MTVNALDHINIVTPALADTVRFFADVLDLTPGDPPAGLDPTRIQWMFDASGRPLVHLSTPKSLGETNPREAAIMSLALAAPERSTTSRSTAAVVTR